ncbi:hypothetical protein [Streptomyces pseudogriseolus]|uniref:hypothetical protein n=1 Tax=Streptomyces pseudogriseolus TaxID=36817 RepID=UPI0036BCD7C8
MTTETTPQTAGLPRHSESGMHTRAINSAAGVLLAAMQQGRQTPAGLAIALDAACLLNSPEHAAEDAALRAERHTTNEALSDAAEQLRADRDRIAELEAELYTAQAHGRTLLEQRNAHAHELLKLRPALHAAQARVVELEARLAEYERPADEDPIAFTLTPAADQLAETGGDQ